MKLTVACVLRSGGLYTSEHVRILHAAVRRHLSFDRFVCLSDIDPDIEGVEWVPMIDRWPGYWSKIELFRPSVFYDDDRVLYLDLDSVILGSLEPLAVRSEKFLAIKDFYRQPPKCEPRLASGLMLWSPRYHGNIYVNFLVNSEAKMAARRFGDQQWIEEFVPAPTYWQDVLPGKVVSFKVHCRPNGGPPKNTAVVAFHGKPRPWDVRERWARNYWREAVPV